MSVVAAVKQRKPYFHIQELINGGASAAEKDKNGNSPLHHACMLRSVETAEVLLKAGVDVNLRNLGITPLHCCFSAVSPSPELVSMLLARGANAMMQSKEGITAVALDSQGAKIHEELQAKGNCPLLQPIKGVAAGSGVYIGGERKGVDRRKDKVDPVTKRKIDAFLRNVKAGKLKEVQQMIQDPETITVENAVNPKDGTTSLHVAAQIRNVQMIILLCEHGAAVDAQNFKGQTALHVAVSLNYVDVVHALLDYEAKPSIADNSGKTPRDLDRAQLIYKAEEVKRRDKRNREVDADRRLHDIQEEERRRELAKENEVEDEAEEVRRMLDLKRREAMERREALQRQKEEQEQQKAADARLELERQASAQELAQEQERQVSAPVLVQEDDVVDIRPRGHDRRQSEEERKRMEDSVRLQEQEQLIAAKEAAVRAARAVPTDQRDIVDQIKRGSVLVGEGSASARVAERVDPRYDYSAIVSKLGIMDRKMIMQVFEGLKPRIRDIVRAQQEVKEKMADVERRLEEGKEAANKSRELRELEKKQKELGQAKEVVVAEVLQLVNLRRETDEAGLKGQIADLEGSIQSMEDEYASLRSELKGAREERLNLLFVEQKKLADDGIRLTLREIQAQNLPPGVTRDSLHIPEEGDVVQSVPEEEAPEVAALQSELQALEDERAKLEESMGSQDNLRRTMEQELARRH